MADQPQTDEAATPQRPGIMLMLGLVALITVGVVIVNRVANVFTPACSNTVLERVSAPGGGHDAVMFNRVCGAGDGFSTQVSVVTAGEDLPDLAGNALVAVDADEPAAWGGPQVEITWLGATELELVVDDTATVSRQSASVSGVSVSVVQAARTE